MLSGEPFTSAPSAALIMALVAIRGKTDSRAGPAHLRLFLVHLSSPSRAPRLLTGRRRVFLTRPPCARSGASWPGDF